MLAFGLPGAGKQSAEGHPFCDGAAIGIVAFRGAVLPQINIATIQPYNGQACGFVKAVRGNSRWIFAGHGAAPTSEKVVTTTFSGFLSCTAQHRQVRVSRVRQYSSVESG